MNALFLNTAAFVGTGVGCYPVFYSARIRADRPRRLGDVLRGPVGSTAVRTAIERFRPLLGVHGHIHESPGQVRIGPTLCVNPGIDLGAKGVERAFRVEG